MTIPLEKPGGWSTNEELTSPQMTEVDTHTTWALDKRSGQTDTCASTVSFTGAMTFAGAVAFTAAVTFSSASSVIFEGTTIFAGVTQLTTNTLTWGAATGDVTFGMGSSTATSTPGQQFILAGQSAFGAGSTGGNVVLEAGTGPAGNGSVIVKIGSSWFAAVFTQALATFLEPVTVIGALQVTAGQFRTAPSNVAYSATPAIDFSQSNVIIVAPLTGGCTFIPTTIIDGAVYWVFASQDSTGGHTGAWGGAVTYKWCGNTSTAVFTASSTTLWQFVGRVIGGNPMLICVSADNVA